MSIFRNKFTIDHMKVQYIALLGLLPSAVFAQGPTLDNANNTPAIGSTFTVSRHNQYVEPGTSGSSQAWNFSNLTANEVVTYEILEVADLINADDFPEATHLITDGNDTLIYKIDGSGWELVGDDVTFNISPLPATDVQTQYTDGVMHLEYPTAFGNSWNDPVLGTYDFDGTIITRSGTIQGNVDGHGTLDLADAYQENILRVYTRQQTSESGTGISGTRRIHTHSFYAEWLKFPLIKFIADSITITIPIGAANNTGRVEWLDTLSIGVIESIEQGEAFGLWPTPARDVLNITLPQRNSEKVQGILRDLTGRTVREWSLSSFGNS
ncbi:MAG: hypothetical protein M3R08_12490, partial [Bacteroidota bacterium]|nr:hypothetical protein [Bacteroidota bacterium]